MVLQTNDEYGARSFLTGLTEPPGETVTVSVPTGPGQTYHTVSDPATGGWKITLNPGFIECSRRNWPSCKCLKRRVWRCIFLQRPIKH